MTKEREAEIRKRHAVPSPNIYCEGCDLLAEIDRLWAMLAAVVYAPEAMLWWEIKQARKALEQK